MIERESELHHTREQVVARVEQDVSLARSLGSGALTAHEADEAIVTAVAEQQHRAAHADRMSHVASREERDMAWSQVERRYTRKQVALFKRLSKNGRAGFHVIKSAEAAPAGALIEDPSRFKPAPSR